ncbi:hypothetical protein [Raoultella ornithinolytica]|uniref:hypothetical protein n=1 Tax=Raoultella ornithinolytica TaxID=54291 RepID=UPI00301C2690
MNKKLVVLSVVLGFSALSHASEPKYAFPQSDQPVVSKIKIENAPSNSERLGHGEILSNGMWVKGNTGSHNRG